MESLKEKIQGPSFILFVIYITTTLCISIFFEKGLFLLWLNEKHNVYGDIFFRYVTFLGDGLVYLMVAIIFVGYSYFNLIILASIAVLQTIFVQIGKRLIFDYPRPKVFFENSMETFNFVEGVKVYGAHSFPSGHTATAFAVATLLICLTKNKLLQVIYMLIAILVAVSRIYLLQHFLVDTVAGAIVGVLSAVAIWWFFTKKKPELLYNRPKLHRGLLR